MLQPTRYPACFKEASRHVLTLQPLIDLIFCLGYLQTNTNNLLRFVHLGTFLCGPVHIANEVTVVLMTSPVHLGSKTSQEADDNHLTVFHFGVVQRCRKTRSLNPLLYLIYACNNWILRLYNKRVSSQS